MRTASGLDGAFLSLETRATPMHVGSLHLFDPPEGPRRDFRDAIKKLIASRIDAAPIFRRQLAQMPLNFANPLWIESDVDLDFHIRSVLLPLPGTQRELQDCVGDLHARLLDRSRPLWMIYVIDGLADGRMAYYIKVHHAVLDGQAGVCWRKRCLTSRRCPAACPRARRHGPSTRAWARWRRRRSSTTPASSSSSCATCRTWRRRWPA